MCFIPEIALRSMAWVELEPPNENCSIACDGEFIYRRIKDQQGYTYRRAQWCAAALVIDWNLLPGFLWELIK